MSTRRDASVCRRSAGATVRRYLNQEQIDQLIAWREQGWGRNRIASKLGVSPGAVHYQCLKHGAVSPKQRAHPVPDEAVTRCGRDGRSQTTFTRADDERLLELEAEGLTYNAIADLMGRPRTSVRVRLMMLALREDMPMASC